MKNPFVAMALMAAAMSEAFREDVSRSAGVQPGGRSGKFASRGEPGQRAPAGMKMIRQFYRAKHGVKVSAEESWKWYRSQR